MGNATCRGNFFMRKIIIVILIIAFIGVFFLNQNEEKEIRVRIIPNSNSAYDLKVKEEAKAITICYLNEARSDNYYIYINNINKTLKKFENALEKELKENVSVELSNHTLYNKTYNNNAVENTSQMTLYVVIGNGEGSNWWGTIYPEFLEVNSSDEIKYESLILSIFNKIKGDKND